MRRGLLTLVGVTAALLAVSIAAAKPSEPLDRRAMKIRAFANRWVGTPYVWGGVSRSGIDCSGYVREMFRELFNVELPRTTRDQINLGIDVNVNPNRLGDGFRPGDLFFYVDHFGTPSHVVTYAGNGLFTHSVSPRGVVVEGMKALWGRRIIARRVLVPGKAGGPQFDAIPAAGPAVPLEIPCPPEIQANPQDVRKFSRDPLTPRDVVDRKDREICEWKALVKRLGSSSDPIAKANIARIEQQIEWLSSLDALRGVLENP